MPNTKISALTAGNPAQSGDEIPVARGGANFKVTAGSIAALSPSGTVTSVGGTGTVNGITLTGTVTSSGNLTLGGTLSGVSLTTQVSGTLPTANGGTNLTSFTSGGAVYATSTSALTTGTLPATAGGTGQASYAVGDLLYASTTTALSKLADVATGNALISGGVGVAPSWGKVGLTTHVSGTLPIANGGTGQTTASAAFNALSPITSTGDLIIGNGSNSATRLAIGTNGYVLTSNGSTASWQPAGGGGGGVTSFTAGSTGLTPNTATTGAVTLSGTLNASNGGTGISSYTYGDLLWSTGSAFTLNKLPIGTAGYVLTSNGSSPQWSALSVSAGSISGTLQPYQGGTGTNTSPSANGQLLIGNGFGGYNVSTLTAGTGISITNGSGSITIASSGGPTINLLNVLTSFGTFMNSTPSSTYSRPLIGHTVSAGQYGAFFFVNTSGGSVVTSTSVSQITVTDTASTTTSYLSGADFGGPGTFTVYDYTVTCYGLNLYNSSMQAIFLASKNAINANSFRPVDAANAFGFGNPQITVNTSGSTYDNSSGQRGILVAKSGGYVIQFASGDLTPASGFFVNNIQVSINGSLSTYMSGSDFTSTFSANSGSGQFTMGLTPSNPALQTLLDNSFL